MGVSRPCGLTGLGQTEQDDVERERVEHEPVPPLFVRRTAVAVGGSSKFSLASRRAPIAHCSIHPPRDPDLSRIRARMKIRARPVLLMLMLLAPWAANAVDSSDAQLEAVRTRIRALEAQLDRLAAETSAVAREQERLTAELELAEARVRENEILLDTSRKEAERLRRETAALAEELASRREMVAKYLEMTALLGGPGPLQLLFDAARGGDLESRCVDGGGAHGGPGPPARRVRRADRAPLGAPRGAERDHGPRPGGGEGARSSAGRARGGACSRRRADASSSNNGSVDRRSARGAPPARAGARSSDGGARLPRTADRQGGHPPLSGRPPVAGRTGPWSGPSAVTTCRSTPPTRSATDCDSLLRVARRWSAVFPGIVAYAQHFKGYGNMVVIDHGNDVYSLAAGLASNSRPTSISRSPWGRDSAWRPRPMTRAMSTSRFALRGRPRIPGAGCSWRRIDDENPGNSHGGFAAHRAAVRGPGCCRQGRLGGSLSCPRQSRRGRSPDPHGVRRRAQRRGPFAVVRRRHRGVDRSLGRRTARRSDRRLPRARERATGLSDWS